MENILSSQTPTDTIITDIGILRKNSERATKEEALSIIPRLKTVLQKTPGLGLAAIQIGITKRVAIVLKEIKPNRELIYYELVNPQIHWGRGGLISTEGCLSLPGIQVQTKRANIIEVSK